ncbi:MAG: hypothetical protein Q9227_003314 [Pyrenula ochraceoflavens]
MLRAEALLSRKEELATCLRSRKRKLNELYFATVTCTILDANPSDTSYQQNERRFLDENDLQNARYFRESTLPARSNFTKNFTRQQTSISHDTVPFKSFPTKQRPTDDQENRNDLLLAPVRAISAKNDGERAKSPSATSTGQNGSEAELQRNNSAQKDEQSRLGDGRNKEILADSVGEDKGETPVALEEQRIEKMVESPPRSPGIDPVELENNQAKARPFGSRDSMVEPMPRAESVQSSVADTIHVRQRDGPSSTPILIPPPAEATSSPASTNGLDSASTPQPPIVSPTTSPGDEEPPQSSEVARPDSGLSPGQRGPDKEMLATGVSPFQTSDSTSNALLTPKTHDAPLNALDRSPRKSPLRDAGPPRSLAASPMPTPGRGTPRKPPIPMHIDTTSASPSGFVESPAEMTGRISVGFTSKRPPPMPITNSPPERMMTRVSSGAIRHKSVSEILGEAPKPSSPQNEKGSSDSSRAGSVPETDLGKDAAGSMMPPRQADRRDKDKERSRLSTVVFATKPPPALESDSIELYRRNANEVDASNRPERDYLYTLFEQKAYQNRGITVNSLLGSANKSLSTADYMVDYKEGKNVRILKRIYQLQNANRWPLRQIERSGEPPRQTSHWDLFLDHAKWLRTDFREERKWKLAAAKGLAEWCAEWCAGDGEKRRSMQVRVKPSKILSKPKEDHDNVVMRDVPPPLEPIPELMPSAEDDSVSEGFDEEAHQAQSLNAPAAIFSLGPLEFSFSLEKTPASDKLLDELPLYRPVSVERDLPLYNLAERRDSAWKKPLLATSKFTTSKIHLLSSDPPRKRSRYEYEQDSHPRKSPPLPAEQIDVALFMPENKHIRDRIHPGHSFRPPAEHPMPSQGFYESRWSSAWTSAEDDELKRLVKDYSYNWSLISSCLSSKSMYHPAADRRTPWECFERWIGLEGLPADMSKTPYFRAYHARIESAGRLLAAQQQAAQQAAGGALVPIRRKTTLPMKVERKRNTRYLAFIDAFRKLAKKREVAAQKQQHVAGLAAMRKANEANQPKPPIKTPQQFSQLKHEREQKLAERQELYRQQFLAHQKAAIQQKTSMPNGGNTAVRTNSGANLNGATPLSASAVAVNASQPLPNGQFPSSQGQQARSLSMAQGLANGQHQNGNMASNIAAMKSMSQGQMPANLGINRPQITSPENMRVLIEANRLQEQQRFAAARQQMAAQQAGQQNQQAPQTSPQSQMAAINGASSNHNAAMFAAMQASNGVSSPSLNTNGSNNVMATGSSTSPRMNVGQSLSSGVTPQINRLIQQISQRQPDLSPEEVKRVATQQLVQQHQHQRSMNQAALNAAAGAANAGIYGMRMGGMQSGMMTNEQVHQYSMLRHRAPMSNGSPSMNMARPVSGHGQSRSATPQIQRSDSQGLQMNGQNGHSQSPTMSQQQMQT